MTKEERETFEELSEVVSRLAQSLAYVELALRDLVAGKHVRARYSVNRGRPTLTIVHGDA